MRRFFRQLKWGSVLTLFVGVVAIGFLVLLVAVKWKAAASGRTGTSEKISKPHKYEQNEQIDRPHKYERNEEIGKPHKYARNDEIAKLQKYERWGEDLNSRDRERMRATLKEMQREDFDKEDLEEFKRLRDKYGRRRRP